MRYILHAKIRETAPRAIAWVKSFMAGYDTSMVGWLRIDFGREHKDRLGRIYYKYRGVYGRCWYPSDDQPTIRLSCQVPGPFPCDIDTCQTPIYRNPDGTWPQAARRIPGPVVVDRRSGRRWKRVYGKTRVADLDEAIIWIFSHEAFHWLRITRQIPGRNTEAQADAFADAQLKSFQQPQVLLFETADLH